MVQDIQINNNIQKYLNDSKSENSKSFYNLENFAEKNIEVINSNNTKDKEIFINFENNKIKIYLKK